MRFQVRISARAERDVDDALDWFQRQRATTAGARWFAQLMARIDTLEKQPDRCRLADEASDVGIELRELPFGRRRGMYRILFEIQGQVVHILRIRHTARDALTPDDL
jgi:plasmid stabilization system protein ParE